jgi:hypothetical protein
MRDWQSKSPSHAFMPYIEAHLPCFKRSPLSCLYPAFGEASVHTCNNVLMNQVCPAAVFLQICSPAHQLNCQCALEALTHPRPDLTGQSQHRLSGACSSTQQATKMNYTRRTLPELHGSQRHRAQKPEPCKHNRGNDQSNCTPTPWACYCPQTTRSPSPFHPHAGRQHTDSLKLSLCSLSRHRKNTNAKTVQTQEGLLLL